MLLCDNTRLHSIRITLEKILDLDCSILPHPPYSPDLTPSNFHLYLQNALKDKRFSQDEVKTFVENLLSSKPAEFNLRGINKHSVEWQEVIQNDEIDWNSLLNYSSINFFTQMKIIYDPTQYIMFHFDFITEVAVLKRRKKITWQYGLFW